MKIFSPFRFLNHSACATIPVINALTLEPGVQPSPCDDGRDDEQLSPECEARSAEGMDSGNHRLTRLDE
jgi:hypothetical protein